MIRHALIIVNYFTAHLTRHAVESAREASRTPLDVILVDNSVDEGELAALREIPRCVVVAMETNRGYAAGINRGMSEVSNDFVVVANPDIAFGPLCIDRLVTALNVAAVTGPRFHWDDGGEWLLPPVDAGSAAGKFGQSFASHSRFLAEMRDRARVRARRRFWETSNPSVQPALSGAVMAMRRSTFHRIGGFDEAFALYFEEIDFFRRLSLEGGRALHVPDAHCRHLYNQSGRLDRMRAEKFTASEARYHSKWGSGWLGRFPSKPPALKPFVTIAADSQIPLPAHSIVELSPLPSFESAAGLVAERTSVRIPDEILASVSPDPLYLRILDREILRESARYELVPIQ